MSRDEINNFTIAYKSVLRKSRRLRKIGAYEKVGDYRDVVNDACVKVIRKFGDELYSKRPSEISSIIVHAVRWARLSRMRTKKDLSSQYLTSYTSQIDGFDVITKCNWATSVELKIDSEINNLPDMLNILDGFNSRDYIDIGLYNNKMTVMRKIKPQLEKMRKIYEDS